MAEMQSPLAGGLSGARRTVSASSALGRPYLSSSLANQIAQASDRETASVLEQNQVALQNVTNSISRISGQMILINNNLLTISNLLSQNSQLENLKSQQEINQERILAEQKLREGKESLIERKMQSVLAAPVQKIGAKAQFSLMNLMSFFNQLFFGWLLNQGVETISALATGNSEKLNAIKDNLLKNLRDVGLTLLALQTGFGFFRGGLLRIGTRIAQAVALKLFSRPITALFDAVKGIAKTVLPEPVLGWLRIAYQYATGQILGPESSTGAGEVSSPSTVIGGMANNMMPGQKEESTGEFLVSAGGALVAFEAGYKYTPGPAWLKTISGLTFSVVGSNVAKGVLNSLTGSSDQAAQTTSDASANAEMKPAESKTDATAQIKATISAPELKDKSQTVPELPKPKSNVTVIDAPQEQASSGTQQKLGLANRTPNVASSNVDNPFPLFGAVTYNVPAAIG